MRISDAQLSHAQRRRHLVAQHGLGVEQSLGSVDAVVERLLALHATDPATVYLSVLARCRAATLDDVREAMYEHRSLVRVLAMRRTLFVVAHDDVPVVHAGASLGVARTMRARLLRQLETIPTDPDVPDPHAWLRGVEEAVDAAMRRLGTASGAQLAEAVPQLRVAFLPTTDKAWDVRRNLTSPVLALLSATGRLVRAEPQGAWTSRHHVWMPIEAWFPDGIADIGEPEARASLARRWLHAFGPGTADDLQWWTGWTKTQTRAALAALDDVVEVDLRDGAGLMLSGTELPDDTEPDPRAVALLPALDPTPMGWKHRDWYLGPHREALFDRFGNIGPTVWSGGRVVGGWAVRADGTIVHRLLEDVGSAVATAVADEGARLEGLLGGSPVTPSFPTPLERELRLG